MEMSIAFAIVLECGHGSSSILDQRAVCEETLSENEIGCHTNNPKSARDVVSSSLSLDVIDYILANAQASDSLTYRTESLMKQSLSNPARRSRSHEVP